MRRPQRAFTLVELLVVIGIIAVLIGILLPVLGRARRNANDIKCRSNLHQIALATRMYENENGDHLPDGYTLGGANYRLLPGMRSPADPNSIPETYGMPALYRSLGYLKSDAVWKCPSARQEIQDWGNSYIWALPGGAALADVQAIPKPPTSNLAKWTSKIRGSPDNFNTYLVWDNYTTYPWTTGFRRGKTDGSPGTFPSPQKPPHDYRTKQTNGTRQGSFNVMFIDGQVGVVVFTVNGSGGTSSDILREP